MQSSELRQLLKKYIDHSISEAEFHRLWKTLAERKSDADWHTIIEQTLSDPTLHNIADPEELEKRLKQLHILIDDREENKKPYFEENEEDSGSAIERPVKSPVIYGMLRYAAILILLLSPVVYFLSRKSPKEIAPLQRVQSFAADSIKPGAQKALLTLANGTEIMLDSVGNGMIAEQGNAKVLKLSNGQIRYEANGPAEEEGKIIYNKMSTPRGGQYRLVLPDGSNIWLNAESSITYPTVFSARERKVTITGEVYFEVAKDKAKPFRVLAGNQEIEVVGTHFNINAYEDEGRVKTSLVEGLVRVNNQILRPGQAFMNGRVASTDIDQDVAWKNGVFNFNNQSLAQVMRQLARWYNLDVVYPTGIPKKEYGGEMGRNLTLDQVLKGLDSSGIRFQLDGRRLMVKS